LKKLRPQWQITALDYSKHMIGFARKNAEHQGLYINWVQNSAEKMSLKSNQFDLVISHYALHEFPDPKAAFKEMIRVSKDGGHIMIEDLRRPPVRVMPFVALNALFYRFYDRELFKQYLRSTRAAYTPRELKDQIWTPQFDGKIEVNNIFHLNVTGVVKKRGKGGSGLDT
jgi:ubiquinone/menaquinone biosynthesis C-methylase UbiE